MRWIETGSNVYTSCILGPTNKSNGDGLVYFNDISKACRLKTRPRKPSQSLDDFPVFATGLVAENLRIKSSPQANWYKIRPMQASIQQNKGDNKDSSKLRNIHLKPPNELP